MAPLLIVLALTTLAVFPAARARGTTPVAAQQPTTLEAKAEQGDTAAQVMLAQRYFRNDDEVNGMKWLRKAAEAGNVDAQNLLGFHYAKDPSTPDHVKQARTWYLKAFDQGSGVAAQNLCLLYTEPMELTKGVDPPGSLPLAPVTASKADVAEAFTWCGKGANAGMPTAEYLFGLLYAHGGGVKPDYEQAYFWLLVGPAPRSLREAVANSLTPEKRAEIEQRAKVWKPTAMTPRVP
jgi:TPR repeat protein